MYTAGSHKMNKLILLLVFIAGLALVEPHGYLLTPLARTSVHRLPNHGGAQQPFWWDDTGVICGNVQQDQNYSTCGRCGDAPGNTHANRGGRYDKGIITGTFNAGQQIDVVVRMTANHRGHFQFDLCTSETESNTCFQRLNIVSGSEPIRSGNMICSGALYQNTDIRARLQLPGGFRCNRCTLRWTYRTSYPPAPDSCWQPQNTQAFRNCADIRIN